MSAHETKVVEFSEIILGFCSAALSYMGYSNEVNKDIIKNLPLAQQNIDIIEMLKNKTQGNLSSEEDSLINQVLKDLKLKYAEAPKA